MKGLLFERLFAFELTTFGSGVADVVCKKLSVRGRKMQIDAHMCGADWVVRPTIMENWQEGSMHCVSEASNERGRRKVDVGFLLLNVATSSTETWRVYCELKCGYKPGKLWDLCWKFLQDMENLAFVSNPHVCAVFVASIPFENFTNLVDDAGLLRQKERFCSTIDTRTGVFFILDGLCRVFSAKIRRKGLIIYARLVKLWADLMSITFPTLSVCQRCRFGRGGAHH